MAIIVNPMPTIAWKIGTMPRVSVFRHHRVQAGDRCVKIVERKKTQHVGNLEADDFLILFVHPTQYGERRVGFGVVKSLKRGEFDRLVLRHALRAGVAGDGLQQRRDERHRQADFQRSAGKIQMFPFEQIPRADADDEKRHRAPGAANGVREAAPAWMG